MAFSTELKELFFNWNDFNPHGHLATSGAIFWWSHLKGAVASLVTQTVVCLQCGRPGFDPWVGKIPWRRSWQPTPVFLPREFHGQRSPVGYSPRGPKSWTRLSD